MNLLSELKALSFPVGSQLIHSVEDDYGRILVVDDGKQRILNFDSVFEQSCMQMSHPSQLVHQYTRFMALAVALVDPAHITLFGLGGGSLLRTLHHTLPQCDFHVIELRQTVATIARDYFLLPDDQRVSITISDAFREIHHLESNSTDIIFSDMYDAYRMAPEQIRKIFLQECARVLTAQGMLVINLLDIPQDQFGFFTLLRQYFPTILVSATTQNTVLFAGKAVLEDGMSPNMGRIESMEMQLQQRLAPLLARVRPWDERAELWPPKSAGIALPAID